MNDQSSRAPVRADLHCHSSASELAVSAAGQPRVLPQCATAPHEVYELAKRRGMDFVTITDHDTIDGVLEIADRPDVFISEELTAWFKNEPRAVHVLCFGITPQDHEWLQAHKGDLVACAEYLHANEIACALAHPFFHTAAPLTAAHRRTLATLFDAWETRNGSGVPELNAAAAIDIETHGGTAVGGSDDHAGIDIGRTYTQAPPAATPAALLEHIRAGRVTPHGQQGGIAEWAHSTLALAARMLAEGPGGGALEPDPRTLLTLARILLRAPDAEHVDPENVRALLRAWLRALELDLDAAGLLSLLQGPGFNHADLERRARRIHERNLLAAASRLTDGSSADLTTATLSACLPALPYIPAAAFLARERVKLAQSDEEPRRVAVIADGLSSSRGIAAALDQLRERSLPGFELDVIGTDAAVDRRLPAVTETEAPFYPGVTLGVPSLFTVAETLTDRRYEVIHICTPGPAGIAAQLIGQVMGLPIVTSHHTDLEPPARATCFEQPLGAMLRSFYGRCRLVLSPSRAADRALLNLGVGPERIWRWERGVDPTRFSPARYSPDALPSGFNVLYAGRLSREKGVHLLAEAFLIAHDRDPRLRLVLAGAGPEEQLLRRRLGASAVFLGWLEGDRLASVYASADLLVFPSAVDTFGQVILEAQASGLPVLAVDAGGSAELIESGRSGCLVPGEPEALASAIRGLARRDTLRDRLSTGGLMAVRERSWERCSSQLAGAYACAIAECSPTAEVARAA